MKGFFPFLYPSLVDLSSLLYSFNETFVFPGYVSMCEISSLMLVNFLFHLVLKEFMID
jgi:hypothetical protein